MASNWINGNGIFSRVNIPLGPIPLNLSVGKGQELFQIGQNINNGISILLNGVELINNAAYGDSYKWSWETFISSGSTTDFLMHGINYFVSHLADASNAFNGF